MPRTNAPPKPSALYTPRCWPVWCLLAVAWLISRLPLAAVIATGRIAGRALYALSGPLRASRRQITDTNIALCFPHLPALERRALARDSFIHTAIGALEITQPWLNPGRDLSPRIHLHGLEHLQTAAAQGRGVLLVGGHFTAIDIVSQGLHKAVNMDVIYRKNRNPAWEWLQRRGRQRYFEAVIERRDTRQILRRLKSGHIVWYAADQDYGARHSVFAPFFGVPAATITATARLAEFNRSPVVFMSNFRHLDSLTWSVHFSPALEHYPSGDPVADASRINQIIEDAIREHPEQYLWMHRRFKTRPGGAGSVYPSRGS
jgi:KDO2-lipid IV(A) lauroyltransferase